MKTTSVFAVTGLLLFMVGLLVGCETKEPQEKKQAPVVKAQPVPGVPPPVPQAHQGKRQGIDVSHYQGLVNWKSVKATGISFAIAKATGGTEFVDSQFNNNWHGMREAGLIRGAYHFFYANEDPIAQAEHFLQTVSSLSAYDLPPLLDVELTEHVPTETIVAGALAWMRHVEQKLGKKPMIYSNVSFYKANLAANFKDYGLWIAEYSDQIQQPDAGRFWQIWQYSQSGSVHGVNGDVDLDIFNGDADQLMDFVNGSGSSTPSPATPAPSTPPASGEQTHTVQHGDNLYRIALRYGVSIEALLQANGIDDPDDIKVGQVLKILR